jgi:hypothetical protein
MTLIKQTPYGHYAIIKNKMTKDNQWIEILSYLIKDSRNIDGT